MSKLGWSQVELEEKCVICYELACFRPTVRDEETARADEAARAEEAAMGLWAYPAFDATKECH
jgi:hypothetical protein